MNKLFLLSFLLLAGCSRAFSQQKNKLWYLTVTDSLNRNRIERATVSAGRSIYVTGADGSAAINRGLIKTGDTIQISCVGYQTITIIPVAGRKMPDTVRLMTVTNSLREVRIHPVNPIILGDARKSYNIHRTTSPDMICAEYIPNDRKISGTIASVEYTVNDKLQGIEMPFKVGLYEKTDGTPFPGPALLSDSIVVRNTRKKNRVVINLLKYHIPLPQNGVIVAFETLSTGYYGADSVMYAGQKYVKTPGIDMDLRKKSDFSADIDDKQDRKTAYALVMDEPNTWTSLEGARRHGYLYRDGNNFAITITIEPDN